MGKIRTTNKRRPARRTYRSSFAYYLRCMEKTGKEPYGYAWRRATAKAKGNGVPHRVRPYLKMILDTARFEQAMVDAASAALAAGENVRSFARAARRLKEATNGG